MASPIPFIYRIVFTYIDPAFCMYGLFTHLFSPIDTVRGYSPAFLNPPQVETIHILDSMAGFFAMLAILEGVLLRVRATDITVWRIVQAGGVMLDAFMTFGALRALSTEGRMDYRDWRGDDWRLVVGNAGMGILRAFCALGLGMRSEKPKRI